LTNKQDQQNAEHDEVATATVEHYGGKSGPFTNTEVETWNAISSE
jgi:hypothetical protein